MNNVDLDIVMSRLTLLFKREPQTLYWILIVNDPYDKTYNLFFNSQKSNEQLRSIPLHKLTNYDLYFLENFINALHQKTNLTIEYIGFTGQVWPQSQRTIQKRRMTLE